MKKLRVLFFDVETSPVLAWIWRVGPNQHISHENIKRGQKFDIITICYKWLGEKQVHSLDWGLREQNSEKMVEAFSRVVASADVVIGHNGDRFDIKQVNTQRLLHGRPPIAWPTSEDTLKQFRKHFYFASNKLDYLAKTLVGAGKDPMSLQDWVDVVENKSAKALKKMIKYCKKDVVRLEQIYQKAAPFMTPRANRAVATDGVCPSCGGKKTHKRGSVVLRSGRYERLQCQACGHVFKGPRVNAP